MMPDEDHLTLHGLALAARVGVPDAERAIPQRLLADVTFWPGGQLSGLGDDLSRTVDYGVAARLCRETAARGESRLIETLADTICGDLLRALPLRMVRVTLRKSVVPATDAVSVTLTRRGDGLPAASTLT
jgi:dihydroneopterin aldolase